MIIQDLHLKNKFRVFRDRYSAGKHLSSLIMDHYGHLGLEVVAIPAGGVPVGTAIAENLDVDLKLILVSKILFPWTTEAGFGAVNMFGDVVLNERAIEVFNLNEETIESQKKITEDKIEKRRELIPEEFLRFEKEACVVVDDGLASGYTMLCAIKGLKRFYDKIIVAVPTASKSSLNLISKFDIVVIVANVRDIYPFAVADAYIEWYDINDRKMLEILMDFKKGKIKNPKFSN